MDSVHYSYVDNVNGNLVCCICRAPFNDPVVTVTCSHTFCRECIESALIVNSQCPIDRSPLTTQQLQPAAAIIRNLVDELIVECTYADAGCGLTCQRMHLDKHLESDCQFVQVQCSQDGCSHLVLRKDLGKHTEGCPHRLVECEACCRDVKLSDMDTHHDECPATEITCVHCSEILPRSALTSHQATCEHIPIPCQHASFGCSWIGPRRLLAAQHLPTCSYEAIKGFFAIHATREKELEQENIELKRKVADLERTTRSHQRDLERAKTRLGPWFKASPDADGGDTGSVNSNDAGSSSAHQRPDMRRRMSVPFNPAVFGVGDTSPTDLIAQRRSSVSTLTPDMQALPSGSLEDPYAGFSTTPHPITGTASPFYGRAHSNSSNPVPPLNVSGSLEGTLSGLRSSIVQLSAAMDSLERKQDIMLTTETLRMHEDVASLRAIVHGLRVQVHNIMMDRNAYFAPRQPQSATSVTFPPNIQTTDIVRPQSSSNLASLSPPPGAGTSYTISHLHPLGQRLDSDSHSDLGDPIPDQGVSSATIYLNRAPPVYYNLSPNVVTTVRRGPPPEGKL